MKIVKFDLSMVNHVVAALPPGRYVLSQLMGDPWELVLRPRWYGWQFKKAVDAGTVKGVRWVRKKSNKSNEYEVAARFPLLPKPAS